MTRLNIITTKQGIEVTTQGIRKSELQALFASLFIFVGSATPVNSHAEDVRDYFSEPGLHPFKQSRGHDLAENIDPGTGVLQLKYTDVYIPGNGGIDIVVQRTYTNPQARPTWHNVNGIGWTMHFGRIVVPSSHAATICGIVDGGPSRYNPSIEFPDGAREMLFYNDIHNDGGDGSLITKSNWKAECITPGLAWDGMRVTSPDGTAYTMDVQSSIIDSQGSALSIGWHTSRIEDVHGNWIEITYEDLPNRGASDQKIVKQVTADSASATDARSVLFSYLDERGLPPDANSLDVRLSSISANGQIWQYEYEEATPDPSSSGLQPLYPGLGYYQLSKVILPDDREWNYTYYSERIALDDADSLALESVTYPQGGIISYTYQSVGFYKWVDLINERTHSIHQKTTSGNIQHGGTWTYNFRPGEGQYAQEPVTLDVTEVWRPDGSWEEYLFYGHNSTIVGDGGTGGYYPDRLWSIGLQRAKEIYSADGKLIDHVANTWDKRRISGQSYLQRNDTVGGPDQDTWAPVLKSTWIDRYKTDDGYGHGALYSAHDEWGNPQTITESHSAATANRVTSLTYYNNPAIWVIGKKDTEEINGIAGLIDRSFSPIGQVLSEDRYAVVTGYTYTQDGDTASVTDAEQNTTYYEDYYRGVPQLERLPEDNIQVHRVVNDRGLVESHWVTSGSDLRDVTKTFTFDLGNRLETIDFRLGDDLSINWPDPNTRILTRGPYMEETRYDGFGNSIKDVRIDANTTARIETVSEYDYLGRLGFSSYPNDITKGIRYTYNVLGEITSKAYPSGSEIRYIYHSENETETLDERGYSTLIRYHFYGSPDNNKQPAEIYTEENATLIHYNELGQVTTIHQGEEVPAGSGTVLGIQRTFEYDSRNFLIGEYHPEINPLNRSGADVVYTRDNLNNVLTKTVGDSNPITYEYDGISRLKKIDYLQASSLSSPDVTISYTMTGAESSRLTSLNWRHYTYDENDNLVEEKIRIMDPYEAYYTDHILQYTIDSLDHLEKIEYPSGKTVSYLP